MSTIVLEFNTDVKMSDALQKVRDAVEMAKPDLPQDVREDLTIREISSTDWPIMQVVLSADYDPVRLKKVAEDLQEEIERVPGVLAVNLSGGVEQEVRIDVDPQLLRYYGVSLTDVMDAVRLENVTLPGGDLGLGTYNYQVRVPGEFESVDVIPNILVNPGALTPVYIRDVAQVTMGIKDRETISRLNGVEAVTLSITKRSGENIIRIADQIRTVLAEFEPRFPEGTRHTVTGDISVYIRDIVAELENNILSGLILVVAVVFLFLGLTNAFFIGSAIPFSMLITFLILRALGVTLNMVVLFSLILAVGMLVDNAIVIVENIYRFRKQGYGPAEAAKAATHQVSGAVISSTLTTVVAFAPMIFWPGIMGEFMKYLPITVIAALSASLFVALVFNPVLCARFMRVSKHPGRMQRFGERLLALGLRPYEPTLRWALKHKGLTLGGMFGLLLLVLGLFAAFNRGVELFPDTDPTFAYVNVEGGSGTRLEVTDTYTRQLEPDVASLGDLKSYVTEVGTSGARGLAGGASASHLGTISIEFLKQEERKGNSRRELASLREKVKDFTGAQLVIDKQEEGPPTGKPVTVEISGDDFPTLGALAEQVKDRIRDIPGLVDLDDDYDRGRPEIRIKPDLEKAGRLGLRTMDLASMIRTAIHGDDVSKYRVGEDEYDIVVRLAEPSRRSVEDIEDLTVFYEGKHIPLTAFADVSYSAGLGAIQRKDSKRMVTVTADAATGYNGNALLGQARRRLADLPLPPGYHIEYAGESEDQQEAQAFLSEAFTVALALIGLVLVTQFGSVTVPLIIMSSVILSTIGVFAGLLVHRMAFGIIMTGVGVISLAGVVVNNAIVLLDFVIKLRKDQGLGLYEALMEAGRTRFRPVALTAITTVLGLVPLTFGLSVDFARLVHGDLKHALIIGGESSQWWGSMGVAVIWGLTIATFLTLVVVPVMYATIEEMKGWFRRRVAIPIKRAVGWSREDSASAS
jgi:multidrug efflux pump